MPSQSKIYTRTVTPGKKGVNIDRARYAIIHDSILAALKEKGEILFVNLPEFVSRKLKGRFDGNISWYTTTVKLDMERRKIIERIPDSKPQVLRMRKKTR
ncbi:MAG: hypothetical protein A2W25_07810 [candidate division Zixibacteria bacterium RBG_16_53_22]|nr:MAG: hypothetical protein A2W25_07810 [candidate division Zixibacteria bacterium RBG_16_53_22]